LRRDWESRGGGETVPAGGRQYAPPRSGETGGKGCRPAGRRGRHARTAGYGSRLTEGTQTAPFAGEQAAQAQAQARAPTRARSLAASWLACGPHNAGRCKRANRQVGGRERDRSSGQRHPRPHGHGQGHDMATSSDGPGLYWWMPITSHRRQRGRWGGRHTGTRCVWPHRTPPS
jgi:hypothetical protein